MAEPVAIRRMTARGSGAPPANLSPPMLENGLGLTIVRPETGDDICHPRLASKQGSDVPLDSNALTNVQLFLDAVRDAAGEEGVRAVQDAKGGIQIKIPRIVREGHWLSQTLGFEVANRVVGALRVFNAEGHWVAFPQFVLPCGFSGTLAKVLAEVDRQLFEGIPVRKIAVAQGVHERTVWRRRAKLVEQGKLERRA